MDICRILLAIPHLNVTNDHLMSIIQGSSAVNGVLVKFQQNLQVLLLEGSFSELSRCVVDLGRDLVALRIFYFSDFQENAIFSDFQVFSQTGAEPVLEPQGLVTSPTELSVESQAPLVHFLYKAMVGMVVRAEYPPVEIVEVLLQEGMSLAEWKELFEGELEIGSSDKIWPAQ